MVRLVKGAYWDTEIKRAQERGLADYPVFTRKSRDRRQLHGLRPRDAGRSRPLPRLRHPQRPHRRHGAGMGRASAATSSSSACTAWARGSTRDLMAERGVAVRVYAPVGGYRDLLAYLVRRLLENGANTSFVHQIADRRDLRRRSCWPIRSPRREATRPHRPSRPSPRPPDMFGPSRRNSAGLDLSDDATVAGSSGDGRRRGRRRSRPRPIVDGRSARGAHGRCSIPPTRPRRRRGGRGDADAVARRSPPPARPAGLGRARPVEARAGDPRASRRPAGARPRAR